MSILTDSNQRHEAIDPAKSFIVSAPAGSGKTELIIQRFLALLSTVKNPEEIICITFTRKAAAEMLSRVYQALESANFSKRPKNPHDAATWELAKNALNHSNELDWKLLDLPWRLRIQTIDSYCRYISQQFSIESNIGDSPEVCDQPTIYYRSAARVLLDRIEEKTVTGKHLGVLLSHLGNDLTRCEDLMSRMLERREQWLPLIYGVNEDQDYFQAVVDRLICENLENLTLLLRPIANELVSLTNQAAGRILKEEDGDLHKLKDMESLPNCSREHISQWKILLRQFLTRNHSWRKRLTVREGYPSSHPESKRRMSELIKWCQEIPDMQRQMLGIMKLPEEPIDKYQQTVLSALTHLLPQLVAELNVLFQKANVCDYTAITLSALEALQSSEIDGKVSNITMRLDYSLRHILIDEFQDTSAIQIRLLESLLQGWEPNDGRSLFLVGDAMQSMYSFRNANVGLFIRAQQSSIANISCKPIMLSTNFRSQRFIIDWVNAYFSHAFPLRDDVSRGAVKYAPSVAFKDNDPLAEVDFFGYCGDYYDDFEAEHIAKICQSIQQRHPEESLAILVRTKNHLKKIIPKLREANVPWQATDIDPLSQRMPVIDMLSLTRALQAPSDRVAWLSVLRAPFCGLGLEDLLAIVNSENSSESNNTIILNQLLKELEAVQGQAHNNMSAHGSETLKRVVPILERAWLNRRRNGLRETIESCWIELGGLSTIENDKDYDDVMRYLDLLGHHGAAGFIDDWDQLTSAVDDLYSIPPVPVNNDAGVAPAQIMTMHKAKGLEFDNVILPGLTSTVREKGKSLLLWSEYIGKEENDGLLMATLGAYDDQDNALYKYLKHEQTERSLLENTRVFYVAATRAIRRLYMYGQLKQNANNWKAPSPSSLLSAIWPRLIRDIKTGKYSVIISEKPSTTKLTKSAVIEGYIRRLPASYPSNTVAKRGINNRQTNSQVDGTATFDKELLHQGHSSRNMQLGTCFHRTIKQIAADGIVNWPPDQIVSMYDGWKGQLRESGMVATAAELNELQRAVENTLNDKCGQWLLANRSMLQVETAFDYRLIANGQIKRSVIDLTFFEDGIRWIVDYKYTHPSTGETLTSFITSMKQLYSDQLYHYASLFREFEKNTVRCGLYMPRLPLFIEISSE